MLPDRLLRQQQQSNAVRSNKAVGYLRVSTEDQARNESLSTQKSKIIAYAETQGLEIVQWFEDDTSAKTVQKREAVKEMLTFLARNKGIVGYAIFYKMWRASRDIVSYSSELKVVLNTLGVAVRSATEPIDESSTGRWLESMLVINGQLDNEIKAGVTKDNMASVARQGWWQSGSLPGYRVGKVKIEGKKTHSTLYQTSQSSIVLELFELFSTGNYTKADIKRVAANKGLRSPKGNVLSDTSIDRMLSQPAYKGYVCNKHTGWEMFEGKHFNRAIVSEELFDKVQRVLRLQSRRANKQGTHKLGSRANPMYPFVKWLVCPSCGKNYRGSAPRTGGGLSHSARYHCSSRECAGKVKSIKADTLHEYFANLLSDITPDDSILKLYKEILNRQSIKQLGNLNRRLDNERKRLSELDKERLETLRNANSGLLSSSEKDEIVAGISAEKMTIQEKIAELEEQQVAKQSSIEYALNFMGDVSKLWVDADPDLKVRFQKMIFPEALTFDTTTLTFGTEKISPLYRYKPNKKDLSVSEKSLLVIPWRIELQLPG